ncbi:MAG: hypothetical protein P4K93_09545 [Terracidiphilus sp.]|nr:hypothetical protein [Terracidiphilus sp.]MDR3798385.1 hypothetical protein [Terracidiphilus sp.]
MFQSSYFIRVSLMAMLLSITSSAQKLDTKSLREILSKQGFTGLLQGKITFKFLGNMRCSSAALGVYYYTWEETNPPGRAIHFSQRLIFIENQSYLGQYVIADRPTLIKADSLRFPYPKDDGNTIQCDQNGLPELVHLGGGDIPLER